MDRKTTPKPQFLGLPEAVVVPRGRAIADFKAAGGHALSFRKGDILDILDQSEAWWEACLDGKRGVIPSNYMEIIVESDDDSHSRGSGSVETLGDRTMTGSFSTHDCDVDSLPSEMKGSFPFPGAKAVESATDDAFVKSVLQVARAMKQVFVPDAKTSLNRIGLFSSKTPAVIFMLELLGWTVKQCADLQAYHKKLSKHSTVVEDDVSVKHLDLEKYL